MTLPELIEVAAKQGGLTIAALIFAFSIYSQRNRLGKAVEAYATVRQGAVIDVFNGKLIVALAKAVAPHVELAIDERFREMPEFMRTKIKELGEHGANNALQEYVAASSTQIATNAAQLSEQGRRLDRMEQMLADVARIAARLEGRLDRD